MKKVNSLTKNAAFAAEEGQDGLKNIDATMVIRSRTRQTCCL
jgi:hypothetical protein